MSRNRLLTIAGTALIGVVLAMLPFAIGRNASGKSSTPTGIPFVGEDLAELDFVTQATYECFEHPHGGGSCHVRGVARREALTEFCSKAGISMTRNGTDIQDRAAIFQYLGNHDIDVPDDLSSGDALVLFGMGGRFRKFYGVYDPPTQRFWISLQFDGSL